jgi:hypothetical protein|tara:strand:- start:1124 stop:1363 length:240 start_codon:yes stop_codon:yes gene_type:complete
MRLIIPKSNRGQMAIVLLLLFSVGLIFYAVMFPELNNIIDGVKSTTTDKTVILIYDVLPIALGFMLILSVVLSIAAIVR